jgi:hypothetical protein
MLLLLLLPVLSHASGGLTLTAFPNGAWGGNATITETVPNIDTSTLASVGGGALGAEAVFSVEIRGSFTPPAALVAKGHRLQLSCEIDNLEAFVWLDDHVIWYVPIGIAVPCPHSGSPRHHPSNTTHCPPPPICLSPHLSLSPSPPPPSTHTHPHHLFLPCSEAGHDPAQWGKYLSDATILPWEYAVSKGEETKPLFLRATLVHPRPTSGAGSTAGGAPSISLKWVVVSSPEQATPAVVPASAFTSDVPAAQSQRLAMQRGLLHGRWGTFAKGSLSAHAILPQGIMVKVGVCDGDGSCVEDATFDDLTANKVRVGSHAYDHSYTQLYMLSSGGCNISIETSQINGEAGADWVALVTPVPAAAPAPAGAGNNTSAAATAAAAAAAAHVANSCAGASSVAIVQFTDTLTGMCAAWHRYGTVTTVPDNASTDGGNNGDGDIVGTASTPQAASTNHTVAVPLGTGLDSVSVWAAGSAWSGAGGGKVPDVRRRECFVNIDEMCVCVCVCVCV